LVPSLTGLKHKCIIAGENTSGESKEKKTGEKLTYLPLEPLSSK